MGDNDLISFITKSRAKNKTDEQIRSSLQSVGWKPEKIDAAFSQMDSGGLTAEQKSDGGDYMPQNVQAAQKKEDARQAIIQQAAAKQQQPSSKPQPDAGEAQPAKQAPPQISPPAKQPQPAATPPAFPVKTPAASAFPAKPQTASTQIATGTASQPPANAQRGGIFKPLQAPSAQPPAQMAPPAAQQPPANPSLTALGKDGMLPTGKSNLPMIAAALVIIALAAAAFIFLSPKAEAPAIPTPAQTNNSSVLPEANNSSQLPLNTTPELQPELPLPPAGEEEGQPILPSLPAPPAAYPTEEMPVPPATNPEPVPPAPAANTTPEPVPEPPPAVVAPPEQPQPAPNTSSTNTSNQSSSNTDLSVGYAQVYQRGSTRGTPASGFCIEYELGHIIQLHYKMYYGAGCTSEKPNTGGFATIDEFKAEKCEFVPCCVNGPLNEYSKGYDLIYCGY
ncbi:MAG: hypothetical protein WCT52_03180 [Candidatus Micrarchaeia archaeon]